MVTSELLSYVSRQITANTTPQDITTQLISQGWQMADIHEALRQSWVSTKQVGRLAITSGRVLMLLQATLHVVMRKWLPLLGLSLLTILVIGISTFLPGPILAFFFTYMVKMHPPWYVYVCGGLGYIIFFVIMGTIQSWGPLAMIHVILHRDEKLSTWKSLGQTRRLVSRFWSLELISALSILGALFLSILPFVFFSLRIIKSAASLTSFSHTLSGPSMVLLITGGILGIIAAGTITLWILFGAQVLVDDSTKPLDAMTKSKQLVSGNLWFIFIRLSVLFGVIIIFAILVIALQPFLRDAALPKRIAEGSILFLLGIFGLIYTTLLYEHIRDQRIQPQRHPLRVKLGFMFLSTMGIIIPVILSILIIMQFGPLFSGLLTGILTKQLKSTQNLPSPLPGYVNPYTGAPGTGNLPAGIPNIPNL